MRPDLLDPMFLRLLAACQRQLLRGATKARYPTRRWVSGPNSGPERCSGYVFGLQTFTAPVPGWTIGGQATEAAKRRALPGQTPPRKFGHPVCPAESPIKASDPTPPRAARRDT